MLYIQPISIHLPYYLPDQMRPFRVTAKLLSRIYLSEQLVFDAPIILVSLQGRNLIFVGSSMLPSMMLYFIFIHSYFMWSEYRCI